MYKIEFSCDSSKLSYYRFAQVGVKYFADIINLATVIRG